MGITRFANNAITTLGSNLGSAATVMTVAAGTGALFPAITGAQFFPITLFASGSATETPNEIVYVTGVSGDTFTISRGQEGTTPQAWSVGDNAGNFPTAAFLNAIAAAQDVQLQPGNYAVDSGTANAGVVALSPAVASLAAMVGMPIRVLKRASPNLGAYTLNVNGLGAKNVVLGGTALESGELPASQIFGVMYNGTNFDLLSPPAIVYNDGLAQMALETVKANITGGTASPTDVPLANLFAALAGPDSETIVLPGGYLLKMKSVLINTGANVTDTPFTWATPFPTGVLGGPVGNPDNNASSTWTAVVVLFTVPDRFGANIRCDTAGNTGVPITNTIHVKVLAIGH